MIQIIQIDDHNERGHAMRTFNWMVAINSSGQKLTGKLCTINIQRNLIC